MRIGNGGMTYITKSKKVFIKSSLECRAFSFYIHSKKAALLLELRHRVTGVRVTRMHIH
jgi:hypothetical protein